MGALRETTYRIAPRGLATSFAESETPPDYALQFRNRTLDSAGGAVKREGIVAFGGKIPGSRAIDAFHEYVSETGETTLMATASGRVFKYDAATSAWSQVYGGGTDGFRYQSVQFDKKLIFVNGKDRPIYTEDVGATWQELKALMEVGQTDTGSNATTLKDPDITDWLTETFVTDYDLVYNATQDAYGVVNAVTTSALTVSTIGSAATGLGQCATDMGPNDRYEIIDMVALNVIPTATIPDNVTTADAGTNATTIAVSGVNFATTEARVGDYVVNTTRNAVARIEAIATAMTVTSVASQQANDSLVFLKSAMPIPSFAHIHYNRLYLVDSRDERKIRISGANDPQDFTTDSLTLDPITVAFNLQAEGDRVVALATFQRYLAICGRRAIYIFQGTNPIGDNSDFAPVSMIPMGVVSRQGVQSIGNNLLFVTDDGVQAISQVLDSSNLNRANVSEPIRNTLRDIIALTPPDQIQLVHYPRRGWLMLHLGSEIYNFGYRNTIREAASNMSTGSWSLFDGPLCQQTAYFVRLSGDFVCGGQGGQCFNFDIGNVFSDNGQAIPTVYQTAWLSTEAARKSSVKIKHGKYIKPLLQAPSDVEYTITAEGGFEGWSTGTGETITLGATDPIGSFTVGSSQIGGSSVANLKVPLRWNGEVVRLTFETDSTEGPDIIGRFTIYSTMEGRR